MYCYKGARFNPDPTLTFDTAKPHICAGRTFGLTVASSVEPAVDSELRLQRPALKPFVNSGVIGGVPYPAHIVAIM